MADINKTVDIQVKADMKQLLAEFKKMPGMTSAEAKKMVSTLQREFKAAEVAAKKAADTNAAALKKMGDSAKRSAKQIRDLKKASREMGGALQATGDLVGELDPALGGFVSTLGMVGTAVRDLGKAVLVGNPAMLALVGAVGAAAAIYSYFNAKAVELENSQKNVKTAMNNANIAIKAQQEAGLAAANALAQHAISVRDLELEYKLLSGEITQLEFDMTNAKTAADNMFEESKKNIENANKANDEAISKQDIYVKNLKKHTDLLREQGKPAAEQAKAISKLHNAEEDLQALKDIRLTQELRMTREAEEQAAAYEETQNKIAKFKDDQRKQQEAEKKAREDAQKYNQRQQAENEKRNKELQAASKAKAEADKVEAENLAELNRMLGIENELIKAKEDAEKQSASIIEQNQRIRISMMEKESDKITENLKLEQDSITEKIDLIKKEQEANLQLAEDAYQKNIALQANLELEEQIALLKEQANLKEEEAGKERIKALEAEKKKRLELINTIVSQSFEGANGVAEIIKNVSGENKKAAMIAFRVNQAAALANIAMTTAQKIMEVAPNPFAIAGVAALGAIQAGVVATQPAPEMHMGGVIDKGEDTRNITVLTGEAVLDRRTVQNLGGDQGINRLQRGQMNQQQQVIVMNPFKHFDRYVQASASRGGAMGKFSNNKAAGDY